MKNITPEPIKHAAQLESFAMPPIRVYEYKGELEPIIEFLSKEKFLHSNGNVKSENVWILEEPVFADLKEFCLECVHQYSKDITNGGQELEIQQSWVNVNEPGMSHPQHWHSNSFLSGVFYLRSEHENGAPIVFSSALRNFPLYLEPAEREDNEKAEHNKYMVSSFKVATVPGSLLVFSSLMPHQVPTNESDSVRISLSFNTFPKRPFGSDTDLNAVKYFS
tara:strand:+ start:705 stop:1367 length:663 start_codon:yes stop_codon:yes gene_type:complete